MYSRVAPAIRRALARPPARDIAALLLLALVWIAYYWRYLPLGLPAADALMLPNGDFWQHFYVYREIAFEALRSGRLPLQYMQLSTRASTTHAEAATGFPLQDVLQFVVPGFVSEWQPLYVGLLPLALAALAAHGVDMLWSALSRRARAAARQVGRALVDVATPAAGLLAIREAACPGWDATVNGALAHVLTVDGVLPGVEVPAGTHQVVLEYRPSTFAVGAVISEITLSACAAIVIYGQGRR